MNGWDALVYLMLAALIVALAASARPVRKPVRGRRPAAQADKTARAER